MEQTAGQAWAANTSAKLRGGVLLGLGALFWVIAILQVLVMVPRRASLSDLSFGFGPYVHEMLVAGRYADCTYAVCDHAARLPLLVWIAFAAGQISQNQQVATVLKDVVFASVSLGVLAWIWRQLPPSSARFRTWLVVGGLMAVGIPVSKHAGQLNYEEGIGIPLLFLLGLAAPLAVKRLTDEAFARKLIALSIGLATLLYLLKASFLIVFGVTLLAAITWGLSRRSLGIVALALLALLAPLSWGAFTKAQTGRFTVMTSFDGENLRRGWNADTARIYPVIEIDRVFDTQTAYLPDGTAIRIEPKPVRKDFANEWAWSDFNRAAAVAWLKAHPQDAAVLALHKVGNYFLSLHKTPVSYSADARHQPAGHRMQDLVVTIWLVAARLVVYAFVAGCVWIWRRQPEKRPAVALSALLAGAYAVPCLAGFNFERHITAGLTLTLGSVLALGPDILELWSGRTKIGDGSGTQ